MRVPTARDWGLPPGLPVGTWVRLGDRLGVVMHHQPEYAQGRFPVRFDDGVWEVRSAADVRVLLPARGGPAGGNGHG